jgi:peptide/nickel transport system substrate-binding protein
MECSRTSFRRFTRLIALALPLLSLAVLAATATRPADAAMARELVIARNSDIRSIDPHVYYSNNEHPVQWHVYESPVRLTAEGKVEPELCESWSASGDGKAWTLKLRKNVKFSDGRPFTAKDVKGTFDRLLASVAAKKKLDYAILFPDLERVDAPDASTVVVHTKQPQASFMYNLSNLMIIPGDDASAAGPNPYTKGIGTGPYRFVEVIKNQRVVLEANPVYWRPGVPKVKRLVYRPIIEDGTRVAALRAGEIDAMFPVPEELAPALKADSAIKVGSVMPWESMFLGLKVDKAPFNNLKAREALSLAIDREGIVKNVFGEGRAMNAYVVPGMVGFHRAIPAPKQDLARAKALLQEAGYKGEELDFIAPEGWYGKVREVTQVIANQLGQAGFKVKLRVLEGGAFIDARRAGSYDLHYLGSRAMTGDPDRYFAERVVADIYRSGYKSDALFDLIKRGGTTMDPARRQKVYEQVQELMARELAPQVFLYQLPTLYAYRTNVQGFQVLPTLMFEAWGVEKADR